MTSPGAISSHYSGPSRTERIFFVEQQAAEYHAQLALLKLDSHADCLLVNFPSEITTIHSLVSLSSPERSAAS